MYKIFNILSIFCLLTLVLAAQQDESYKLFYPEYVSLNSSFETAIITTNKFHKADKFEIYISSGDKILLENVELKSFNSSFKLNFSRSVDDEIEGTHYKSVIDLTDTTISDTYFQILFHFKNENANSASIKFLGKYLQEDSTLAYLTNRGISRQKGNFITANIRFYKPQKNAGKSILFTNNSFFESSVKNVETKKLLSEFWIKLNNTSISFLKISSKKETNFEYKLFTNIFQMLSVTSQMNDPVYLNPCFTSKKAWYHIAIEFLTEKNVIIFYCNSKVFAKFNTPVFVDLNEITFELINYENGKSYQIDQLRFVDFNNSIESSFNNKNYANWISDSSDVIAQYNFDDNEEFTSVTKNSLFNFANIQYVKSDAPVFARAPELNINLLSSAFELEWSGGDFKQADLYVLEKSINNSEYFSVFTTHADNTLEKRYSYLDKVEEATDIIYYRIKQINKDATVVYSSQVKVGHGLTEPFTIEQNFPNPFNPKTSIEIELLEDLEVKVIVYNLEGREIIKLYEGNLSKGKHKFTFDGTELPSGVYLYKISTPNFSQTKKMILAK